MKRLVGLCFLFLLSVSATLAQTAVVTRNVNLRPDPSTDQKPLATLAPPAEVQILETQPTNGFYHVKAGANEGWIWGRNMKIQPAMSAQPASVGGTLGIIEPDPVSEIASSWPKGTRENKVLHDSEGDCDIAGDGGDSGTNLLKNRSDVPSAYHHVSWDAINNLGYPHAARVNDFETGAHEI